ncbi:hypothetical protein V2J52_13335 [Georgenia sp. MJ173]|uniref:tetratricopeptide repeat protein n=1 Tax=Georgenia sunbinii TaxID=3117728 RepID=UPI002F266243
MREPISEADLDAADFSGGSHRGVADRLVGWAREPHPGDVVSARELLVRAGEQLEQAEDDAAAERLYREAVAMTGEVFLDPRCHLAEVLVRRGALDEALAVDAELRRSRPDSAVAYRYMAETWQSHGDPRRALGWYNRALSRHEQGDGFTADDLGWLCHERWLLREQEGHPPDEYDLVGIGWLEQPRE